MGDASTVLTEREAIQLFRRSGFGFRRRDVERVLARGETRGEVVDRLLGRRPGRFRPSGATIDRVHDSWVKYMLRTRRQAQEKMVLFLHDHFATSADTVDEPRWMAKQNQLFRIHSTGNFRDLVRAVNRDPAMMEFLDTVRNKKAEPNENYAREFLELFTLGVADLQGQPTYEQEDIVQIARAFTGWRVDDRGKAYLRTGQHDFQADYPERGPKVVFRNHGGFGPQGRDFTVNGEGEAEIDTVVDIVFEHRDSEGKNTVARHLVRKLLDFYAFVDPDPGRRKLVVDEIVAASAFDTTWDLGGLLRTIFVHDVFYETCKPFGEAVAKSVIWPVDYVVGTMRTLGMRLRGRDAYVDGGSYGLVRDHLANMGQVLFAPPSVFGWDWETAWLNSGTLLARYAFARDLAAARKRPHGSARGRTAFRPEKLLDTSRIGTPVRDIAEEMLAVLGRTDDFTDTEKTTLASYLGDGNPNGTLDLTDENVRLTKLHGLLSLVLQAPASLFH
ncbi:MAG: hypothetical protein KatS3mg076_1240 [Candidatus Binatia bacterium]|nr:MAG: hypothetical protein KatS3mg076_1240 [Candidatus Binatia bacterium]